jgi:hypothetical protein
MQRRAPATDRPYGIFLERKIHLVHRFPAELQPRIGLTNVTEIPPDHLVMRRFPYASQGQLLGSRRITIDD